MIALDTNVLVYAHREDSPHHERAGAALRRLVDGGSPFGIPWPVVHEFAAVVTHPRIYDPPSDTAAALAAMSALAGVPHARFLAESADHLALLSRLLGPGVVGPKVHDARTAAICLGHGVRELWSADRDFSWFPALTVVNPLIGALR